MVIIATVLAIGYSHLSSRRGEASDVDDEVENVTVPDSVSS
jgi:hypothetical protein